MFRRLWVSPIIGVLGAGAALGPYGLGSLSHRIGFFSFTMLDDIHAVEPIAGSGVVLAPGGEFAFVLFAAAVASGIIDAPDGAHTEIAVTVSLFAVPALAVLARRLIRKIPRADVVLTIAPKNETAPPRALLIGYGRVGQLVGSMMRKNAIGYLAIDEDVATVRTFRSVGVAITWGSAASMVS